MFVLLTRPLDEATQTAERLADLGHTAVLSPVIDIVPTGASWPHGVIDAVVATSARAFQCLELAPNWPTPEARRLYPLFVVGAKTAEAARTRGFEGQAQITLDAKALCSVIRERFEPGTRVVYLAGRDRKSDLETCCRKAGVTLDAVESYAAQSAPHLSDEAVRLAADGIIGAALHFSRRSAEIFLRLATEEDFDAAPLIHVAISADAAAPLAALPKVVVVQEPSEDAILALFRPPSGART